MIMKKKLIIILTISACAIFSIMALKKNSEEKQTTKQTTTTNYQTVVFKDKQDTLVPLSVDFAVEMEPDNKYRNMIEVMKSSDYEYLGLYPILDSNLQVNAISINDTALTFDLSDHLYVNNNQEALDILELFSYVFCQDDIEKVNLKIDGNDITTLPNSTIPTSCITKNLGINNFESSTNYIYKTTPLVVYNPKMINNQEYYVPVTKRIETETTDIDSKVSLMLEQIEFDKPLTLVDGCSLEEGRLSIHLASNILNDNESIDNILYNQIVKSASHLDNVKSVAIYIDDQEISPVDDVNGEVDNRIKI